jgi:hypothetical protein
MNSGKHRYTENVTLLRVPVNDQVRIRQPNVNDAAIIAKAAPPDGFFMTRTAVSDGRRSSLASGGGRVFESAEIHEECHCLTGQNSFASMGRHCFFSALPYI